MTFRLTKHHGLGNDFLVLLGTEADLAAVTPAHAVRWCARHTGVGADGLLLGVTDAPGVDLVMTLFNADGSRAEMSGNGIRCLAQAEIDRRVAAGTPHDGAVELHIATDGGPRTVTVHPGPDAASVVAAVDMGPAGPGPTADRPPAQPVDDPVALAAEPKQSLAVDMGNPHLVLLVEDPSAVDIHRAGPFWEAGYDAGINVHAVAPTPGADDELTMAIWERGAGATLACGTGATAAAHAAHAWGLVGTRVTVHMPGGDVEVAVGERMTLHGPSVRIATVEVEA
ncbi:MAG TPA: diaminopimelate epimerase [Iamia sp.]|nr:diaminopimelate epimerase [Iamia sp.]